ncbi:EAL domain-containing protein [Solibacillus sp. MA9]|uniref:EAL domain-containing protein n=1 Tax=Solibacillus palustris TaxID=2908203 RepID=A0ABS9U8K1_9BACL|nr:GGDEF domain-containing phosphodiesterase [Solibacillus sp. MA9]MCH7320563.1 EAL domain-containing protein [Solibacillus sp. MA9]
MEKISVSYFERLKKIGDHIQTNRIIIDDTFQIIDSNLVCSQGNFQQLSNLLEFLIFQPEEQQRFVSSIINATGEPIKVHYSRQDGSTCLVQLHSVPILLEKQYYMLIMVEVEPNASVVLTHTANDIIIQETSFENKIQKICTELERLYRVMITFTYTKKHSILLIPSNSFKGVEIPPISSEEQHYHSQMRGKALVQLALHQSTKQYAEQNGYSNSFVVPVCTIENEAIGYFVIYHNEREIFDKEDDLFQERLIQVVQLLDKISMYEQQIQILQTIDSTTNLPSYQQFIKQLNLHKQQQKVGVIKIIEPGEFSKVVELYGRPAGDELLRQLGKHLKQASISKDSEIARFTSSSLIMYTPVDFQTLFNRQSVISGDEMESFTIFNQQIHITLKVGIAPLDDYTSTHDSVRFAEYALTKARQIHGAHTEFYTARHDDILGREIQLSNHLKNAIRSKEITAYFQPKYAVYNEKIASMEALARWFSPSLGFISPVEFIAIAENTGLIRDLELQIIEKVLAWQQQRQYDGKRIVPIAVNISPDHFYHPQFIPNLKHLLNHYYADPKYLIVEVTENMGLFDFERANKIINKLQTIGIVTSIDDFGIGYSSLSYLQKFSFNELKIDRSFVMKIEELATQTIVKAIIDIAHTLDMVVIAEGVETKEQRDILKAIHCDEIQGYYYSKPLSMEEASKLIDDERQKRK